MTCATEVIFQFISVVVHFHSRSPGNKWALDQAKRNLVEKYLLVGITEEIGDFLAILEATVPRIFKGATKLFNEGTASYMCYFT